MCLIFQHLTVHDWTNFEITQKHLIILFSVIPVKFKKKSKAKHYMYVKAHNVRESHVSKPRDRTLFVLNVPPYCNKVSTFANGLSDVCRHLFVKGICIIFWLPVHTLLNYCQFFTRNVCEDYFQNVVQFKMSIFIRSQVLVSLKTCRNHILTWPQK